MNGQGQKGLKLVDLAMCRDHASSKCRWGAGGIADSVQPVDLGQLLDQAGKRVIARPLRPTRDRR